IPEAAPRHQISTFDYRETLAVLDRILREKVGHYNVTVAPFGSKMQGVGIALFNLLYPEIRIILAKPREYNSAYSGRTCATWPVDFGSTAEMRRRLERAGELSIKD